MGYQLRRPLYFEPPDRLPSVQIGRLAPTGGVVSCDLSFEGRDHTLWRLRIAVLGGVLYDEPEAIRGPVAGFGRGRQAAAIMATAVSFLLADAEKYRAAMSRHQDDADWVFNQRVAEWAYLNDTELAAMADELAGAQ